MRSKMLPLVGLVLALFAAGNARALTTLEWGSQVVGTSAWTSGGSGVWGSDHAANRDGLVGDLHNYGDAGDMATTMQEHWMAGTAGNVQIVFNFDQTYPVAEMWVWNLNNYDPARGLRKVHIEYSEDGTNWMEVTGWTNRLTGLAEFAKAPGTADYAHNTEVDLGGVVAQHIRITPLGVDPDTHAKDMPVIQNEGTWGSDGRGGLSEVRFFTGEPTKAQNPTPSDAAGSLSRNVTLEWEAGGKAVSHDVYFGGDETAVANATSGSAEYKGNQTEPTYSPGELELDPIQA